MTARTPELRVFENQIEDTSRMSAGLSVTEYMLGSIATSLKRLADAAALPEPGAAGEALPLDDHIVGRFAKAIMHGSIEHRRWLAAAARQFIAEGAVEKSTAEHDEYERGRREERNAIALWHESVAAVADGRASGEINPGVRANFEDEARIHRRSAVAIRQRITREG